MEKTIAGSWNRKSRVLGGETAEQSEKGIVGSGKTAEKKRAQSPKSNGSNGGDPLSENNTKKILLLSYFFSQQVREKIVGGFHDEYSFEFLFDMSVPIEFL